MCVVCVCAHVCVCACVCVCVCVCDCVGEGGCWERGGGFIMVTDVLYNIYVSIHFCVKCFELHWVVDIAL